MLPADFRRVAEVSDDERTPVVLHAKPAPVVVRAGTTVKGPPPLPPRPTQRAATPLGGTLAPLGSRSVLVPVSGPETFTGDEPPTASRANAAIAARLVRNWAACSVEDQRLIEALAVRLRPGVG